MLFKGENGHHNDVDMKPNSVLKGQMKISGEFTSSLRNIIIGPTRSWKVLKEMYEGFENVGVTDVKCRNYKHDLTIFIGNRDVEMVVEKLLSRQDL
ncbi:hypothetical protein Tco_1232534 [Tanacetum coccineum]